MPNNFSTLLNNLGNSPEFQKFAKKNQTVITQYNKPKYHGLDSEVARLLQVGSYSKFIQASLMALLLWPVEILIYPMARFINLLLKIIIGRKRFKSSLQVLMIIGGYVGGALLATNILVSIPAVVAAVSAFQLLLSTSLILVFAAALVGGFIGKVFNRNFFPSAALGAVLGLIIPIAIFPAFDLMFGAAVLGGFIAAFVGKHIMRLSYKLFSGHTNADGYGNLVGNKVDAKVEQIAKVLTVKPQAVANLKDTLLKLLGNWNKRTSRLAKISGSDNQTKQSIKEVLVKLANVKTPDDAKDLRRVLNMTGSASRNMRPILKNLERKNDSSDFQKSLKIKKDFASDFENAFQGDANLSHEYERHMQAIATSPFSAFSW